MEDNYKQTALFINFLEPNFLRYFGESLLMEGIGHLALAVSFVRAIITSHPVGTNSRLDGATTLFIPSLKFGYSIISLNLNSKYVKGGSHIWHPCNFGFFWLLPPSLSAKSALFVTKFAAFPHPLPENHRYQNFWFWQKTKLLVTGYWKSRIFCWKRIFYRNTECSG